MNKKEVRSGQLSVVLSSAGDDIAAVKKIAAAAIEVVAEQEQELEEALKLNDELQEKLELANSGVKFIPFIEVDGVTYNAIHAVKLDGKVYQPKDIAENADIAARLVKGNSSALEAQPAKESATD